MDSLNYRPCVGIMLFNRAGLVFVGRRRNKKIPEHLRQGHEWQMPQGGIDAGEAPYQAALRELREETNVSSTTFLAESSDWYSYDLPDGSLKKSWKGRFQGQRQKWFALQFSRARKPRSTSTPPPADSGRNSTRGDGSRSAVSPN